MSFGSLEFWSKRQKNLIYVVLRQTEECKTRSLTASDIYRKCKKVALFQTSAIYIGGKNCLNKIQSTEIE